MLWACTLGARATMLCSFGPQGLSEHLARHRHQQLAAMYRSSLGSRLEGAPLPACPIRLDLMRELACVYLAHQG